MRTLLTTTALVALFSMGAVAQDAAAPAGDSDLLTQGYDVIDTDALASKLIGFPVYSSAAADAEQLGEINDIVIGEDGGVAAVILGVGGFLGVGEKNVAVDYGQLQWTVAEDETERLVLEVTREQLETAQAVELVEDEPMDTAAATDQPADDAMQPADDETETAVVDAQPPADDAMQPADDATETAAVDADQPADAAQQPADDATETAAADTEQQQPVADQDDAMETAEAQPADDAAVDQNLETGAIGQQDDVTAQDPSMQALDRESLVDFDETTLTAEQLIGINVYGPTDEHIGVIGDFVLGQDDKIDAVIIDFGGFLGIGTKQVAIAYENLDFYSDEAGNNRYLILNVTRDMMEQAPEFNSETYAQERDTQRLLLEDGDTAAAN